MAATALGSTVPQVGESDFDPVAGMDTVDLFDFIRATQRERWGQLVELPGTAATLFRRGWVS